MNQYTPRRCSKRWLDADCPRGVLAIMDHPNEIDRYTVFYSEPVADDGRKSWLQYLATNADGCFSYHDEMPAYQVANFRYRNKHRYIRWSDLPETVKNIVRRDLEESAE